MVPQLTTLSVNKVLLLPPPVLVHRPDLARGLRALHDIRVRTPLLLQVQSCPRAILRKTKVRFAPDDDVVLADLQRETGVPNYRLVAAALLVPVYDQTCSTHGSRELVPAADKTILWWPSPSLPCPAHLAGEPAIPLALPLESPTSVGDLLASHDDAALAERLAATGQAWAESPCDTTEDILHRAALGLRLLEQAVAAAARRRPTAAAVTEPTEALAREIPALDIL